MHAVSALLTACSGFLLAVLWMDLMFDVQVLRFRRQGPELPESVLASIAAYYHRVTTSARPMGHLVAVVMAIAVTTLLVQLTADEDRRSLALLSAPFCLGPILLGLLRIFPNAVSLGNRTGTLLEQSVRARAICREHLGCFVSMLCFAALQIFTS
jgi:hypothetical protein